MINTNPSQASDLADIELIASADEALPALLAEPPPAGYPSLSDRSPNHGHEGKDTDRT